MDLLRVARTVSLQRDSFTGLAVERDKHHAAFARLTQQFVSQDLERWLEVISGHWEMRNSTWLQPLAAGSSSGTRAHMTTLPARPTSRGGVGDEILQVRG